MKTLWHIAVLLQLMLFSAIGATAGMCASPIPHEDMVRVLEKKYSETRTGIGLAGQVIVVETFKTKNGSTWTIVATTPDRKSCIIASGEHWDEVKPEPAGMKS